MALVENTAPAEEPVTRAEAALFMRMLDLCRMMLLIP